MSYETLKSKLVKMPAAGERGFEGVMATLLSALTGERFYVARSGDQPADAVSAGAGIAVQCKRYDKTKIDETEFEGDFHKACRTVSSLDCYVVATTRQHAQLIGLAEAIQNENGVDIVLLDFDGPTSGVAALCVTFWQQIRSFPKLIELDQAFADWATTEAAKPEVQAAVAELRTSLLSSVPHAGVVRRRLEARLNHRFGISAFSHLATRYPINLSQAVARTAPQQLLTHWWSADQSRAAVVVGEEGMGKSWIAAAFANSLSNSGNLVLWLDSADWSGVGSLDEAIASGLLHAGYDDKAIRDRLARKARTRWRDRLLLVLDGVNERNSHGSASKVLAELQASKIRPCRLLFTTRPKEWPSDQRSLWRLATNVDASPFTDAELEQALANLPEPLRLAEIPLGLRDVARIPRYFHRAIALRSEFKSLGNLTIEMVLWADLLEKIKSGDPQLTEKIGWQSPADVKRALLQLADAATAIAGAQNEPNNYELLSAAIRNFEQVRMDLAEQRVVVEPTGENPTPSREHVVLGFALHIAAVLRRRRDENIPALVDAIAKELEPTLVQDQLTEALFVALQLSALSGNTADALRSNARAALLVAWTASQNSRIDPGRLAFWAERDVEAYLDFVEEIFCETVSEAWMDLVIDPLRRQWKESKGTDQALAGRIRKWLVLVWQSSSSTDSGEFQVFGRAFPRARTSNQLRLSFIALAILTEVLVPEFFADLAVAWALDKFSLRQVKFPREATGSAEQIHQIPCKDLGDNIGPVVRWIITEGKKADFERLKSSAPNDSLEFKGYGHMLTAFESFGWTRMQEPEVLLRQKTPFFGGTGPDAPVLLEKCTPLAIRQDIPDLSTQDRETLKTKLQVLFHSVELRSGFGSTLADLNFDLLFPWFAKYHPESLVELATEFRTLALTHEDPGPALSIANRLPYSGTKISPAKLLELAKSWTEKTAGTTEPRGDWNILQVHLMALTCFREAELLEWLRFCSERPRLRREIHFNPIPDLAPFLIPDSIARIAREELKAHADDPEPTSVSDTVFDYWATIGGASGPPDPEFHNWAREQIKSRNPQRQRRFYWLLLFFRSATEEQLRELVKTGEIVDFVSRRELRALHTADRDIDNWTDLSLDLISLTSALSIDSVGRMLRAAGRRNDIVLWGEALFRRAFELLGHTTFEPGFWGTTVLQRNRHGDDSGRTCENEMVRDETEGLRPPENIERESVSSIEFEREANRRLAIWSNDLRAVEKIDDGAFLHFDAVRSLEQFRDENPELFAKFANTLLNKAKEQPQKAYPIAGFLISTQTALVPLDPVAAIDSARSLEPLRVRMTNHYNVSVVSQAVWRAAANANEQCAGVCRDLLNNTVTDEELMWQVLTAQAEGATDLLARIASELLNSSLAKDRCLAVSIMAWMPGAFTKLESLAQSDPSGWVCAHSKWAAELSRQETDARNYYRKAISGTDYNETLRQLQVLEPALTPSANTWRFRIDDEFAATMPDRVRVAVYLFWEGVESKLRRTDKLYGRELKEYLRGERVKDIQAPQPPLLQ